jgi:hypothetical protein
MTQKSYSWLIAYKLTETYQLTDLLFKLILQLDDYTKI